MVCLLLLRRLRAEMRNEFPIFLADCGRDWGSGEDRGEEKRKVLFDRQTRVSILGIGPFRAWGEGENAAVQGRIGRGEEKANRSFSLFLSLFLYLFSLRPHCIALSKGEQEKGKKKEIRCGKLELSQHCTEYIGKENLFSPSSLYLSSKSPHLLPPPPPLYFPLLAMELFLFSLSLCARNGARYDLLFFPREVI